MTKPTVKDGTALVVAADSVRARLFAAETSAGPLRELVDLLNPEARQHENELVEDAGGRRNLRPTQAKHSAFGGQTAKRHRAEEFAADVCARAAETLRASGADRLYLVADPEFLGLLRQRMDAQLQKRVAGSVAKSITGGSIDTIRAALPRAL